MRNMSNNVKAGDNYDKTFLVNCFVVGCYCPGLARFRRLGHAVLAHLWIVHLGIDGA